MNIAFIHRHLPPFAFGGVCFQVHYLANSLVQRGHQVTCFTVDPPPIGALYEVKIVSLSGPSRVNKFLEFVEFSLQVARQNYRGFDLVHAHGDNHFLRPPIPHIRTFYGSAVDEALTATRFRRVVGQLLVMASERLAGWQSDWSVGISEATRRRLPFIHQVIPCGIDLNIFRPGRGKSVAPSILFVGEIRGRKRGGVLVEIFQKHVKKALSEAELWMVCHDPVEGDGIRWFGKIPTPQLVGLYQQAWVFCSPSSYEGFGVPSLEAMACGTPVVASPNVGAMEVLGGGEYGLLSPDSTLPDDLVRMLTDKTLRDLYVRKGLDRVRYFSWENIVRKYEELYVQILSRLQKQREVR